MDLLDVEIELVDVAPELLHRMNRHGWLHHDGRALGGGAQRGGERAQRGGERAQRGENEIPKQHDGALLAARIVSARFWRGGAGRASSKRMKGAV